METTCSKCGIKLTVRDSIYYDVPAGSKNSSCQKCYDEYTAPVSVQEHVHVESIDSLCEKLDSVKFELNTPERIALFKHFKKLSAALKEIEGGGGNEPEVIINAIGHTELIESCVAEANRTIEHLTQLLKEIEMR